jgi:hypothetical protein
MQIIICFQEKRKTIMYEQILYHNKKFKANARLKNRNDKKMMACNEGTALYYHSENLEL